MNIGYLVSLLPYLACPVGMSLLMWLMMSGNKSGETSTAQAPPKSTASPPPVTAPGDRLAQLREQLGDLQAQQVAIAAQVAHLSVDDERSRGQHGNRLGSGTGVVARALKRAAPTIPASNERRT